MKNLKRFHNFHFYILLLLLMYGIENESQAQQKTGEETKLTNKEIKGVNISDYTFTRVKHFRKTGEVEKLRLSELNGKWTILYFWTRNCTPCIKSFPKLDEIQTENSAKVQVILVGIKDMWNKTIEPYFDGVRNAQEINLPIAYDTGLVNNLAIIYASTIVVVSPEGIVESIFASDGQLKKRIKAILRRRSRLTKGA